jgi:ribosomal protein L4
MMALSGVGPHRDGMRKGKGGRRILFWGRQGAGRPRMGSRRSGVAVDDGPQFDGSPGHGSSS